MSRNGFGASPPQTKKKENASNTIIRFQLATFEALWAQKVKNIRAAKRRVSSGWLSLHQRHSILSNHQLLISRQHHHLNLRVSSANDSVLAEHNLSILLLVKLYTQELQAFTYGLAYFMTVLTHATSKYSTSTPPIAAANAPMYFLMR